MLTHFSYGEFNMGYKTTLRSVHIFANAKTSYNSNIKRNFSFGSQEVHNDKKI